MVTFSIPDDSDYLARSGLLDLEHVARFSVTYKFADAYAGSHGAIGPRHHADGGSPLRIVPC